MENRLMVSGGQGWWRKACSVYKTAWDMHVVVEISHIVTILMSTSYYNFADEQIPGMEGPVPTMHLLPDPHTGFPCTKALKDGDGGKESWGTMRCVLKQDSLWNEGIRRSRPKVVEKEHSSKEVHLNTKEKIEGKTGTLWRQFLHSWKV